MDATTTYLTDLGLSTYEARAYVTLARHGPMTADQVASKSEVPRGRIYDVLNSLADRALVRADDGRPKTYTNAEVSTAIDGLLEARVAELEDERREFERTASTAQRALDGLSADITNEDFATSAFRDGAARDLLLERFAAAESSILIATDDVAVAPEWRETIATRVLELLEVDVEVRLLATAFDGVTDRFDRLREAGLCTRRTDAVPRQRFIVIDESEVCLEVLHPLESEELLALVNFRDPEIARDLTENFERLWERGEPPDERAEADG